MGGFYPAGVTDGDVEGRYETEQDERDREIVERILRRHVRWCEYLETEDPGDRFDMVVEMLPDVFEVLDVNRYDLSDYAERLRDGRES